MAKLLISIALFVLCSAYASGQDSFRGGHFTWRPGKKNNEILIDYSLFFDLNGEEAKKCTDQAMKDKTLISTDMPLLVWNTDPEGQKGASKEKPKEIAKVKFYCTMKDSKTMKRMVGEFKGHSYVSQQKEFFIGVKGPVASLLIYTSVDLNTRADTHTINTPPKLMFFPYYQVDGFADGKIPIHGVDEDNDFIRCTSLGTNNVLKNCEMVIPSGLSNGLYRARVLVEDLRNKDEQKGFSKLIMAFDVQKLDPKVDVLKPKFSMENSYTCVNQPNTKQPWMKSFQITYNDDRVQLNDLKVLAPQGVTYASTPGSKKGKFDVFVEWTPKEEDKGKHILCFFISATEKANQKMHVAEEKCWYLSLGKDFQSMKIEFLKPKHEGIIRPDDFDSFEIKVFGAFEKPSSRSGHFLLVQNRKNGQLQYNLNLNQAGTFSITSDNKIIIASKMMTRLATEQEYYVTIFGNLFEPQARCAKAPSIRGDAAGDYTWNFEVSNREVIPEELKLSQGKLFKTIPLLYQTWRVQFKVRPSKEKRNNKHANIIQFTTGGSCCSYGQRTPGVWFIPNSNKLMVASAVNGQGNHMYNSNIELPTDRFTNVTIEQVEDIFGQHMYRIYIADKEVYSVHNTETRELRNVKIYTSNPFGEMSNAKVASFRYETPIEREDASVITGNRGGVAALTKPTYKTNLTCEHNRFKFDFHYANASEIEEIVLLDTTCKMKYNSKAKYYEITSNYSHCGSVVKEEQKSIVLKNVALVFFKGQKSTSASSLITRAASYNIGLECHLKKTYLNTIKGKREEDVVGELQSITINTYARGTASFKIDFQVYKTSAYRESYGFEEFPIYMGGANRIFLELSIDEKNLRLAPQNCYATKKKDHTSEPRYYIIQERCQKDNTYVQHRYTNQVFQYSVQAFNFKDGGDSLYIHCESYICKNTTNEKCRFGCDKDKPMRTMGRRSAEVKEEMETYMTSTLEIKLDYGTPVHQSTKSDDDDSTNKVLLFMQIPIAVLIVSIIYMIYRCTRGRRSGKVIYLTGDEARLTDNL